MSSTSQTTLQHAAKVRSSCKIAAISQFENWDKRECAVDAENVSWWKNEVDRFLENAPPSVPKHIHQIWIGTREPPCVWLDTWRIDFMSRESNEWFVFVFLSHRLVSRAIPLSPLLGSHILGCIEAIR